jgi:anti-sigma regulatory factor (Ser/Thr protein kinase)
VPFLAEAVHRRTPALVATSARQIDLLRDGLRGETSGVTFVDMPSIGRNPACIIPVWQDFIDLHEGQALRGIGEPIWAGRSEAELEECHRHEALLNHAIAHDTPLHLICPYDTAALDPATVARARHTHPECGHDQLDRGEGAFAGPAPTPPGDALLLEVDLLGIPGLRDRVQPEVARLGLSAARREDVGLVLIELCTNAIRHGNGRGRVAVWSEGGSVLCQVEDEGGPIIDPLVGRRRPTLEQDGGRGLWLVNHLSDLVQIRSRPGRTTVTARWALDRP